MRAAGVKLRWDAEFEPLSKGLHFGHPLPHSIKNFVNDDRGTPGGDARLQIQIVQPVGINR